MLYAINDGGDISAQLQKSSFQIGIIHFYVIILYQQIVLWCNGSTTDSGPVCLGSNPSKTTKKFKDC